MAARPDSVKKTTKNSKATSKKSTKQKPQMVVEALNGAQSDAGMKEPKRALSISDFVGNSFVRTPSVVGSLYNDSDEEALTPVVEKLVESDSCTPTQPVFSHVSPKAAEPPKSTPISQLPQSTPEMKQKKETEKGKEKKDKTEKANGARGRKIDASFKQESKEKEKKPVKDSKRPSSKRQRDSDTSDDTDSTKAVELSEPSDLGIGRSNAISSVSWTPGFKAKTEAEASKALDMDKSPDKDKEKDAAAPFRYKKPERSKAAEASSSKTEGKAKKARTS